MKDIEITRAGKRIRFLNLCRMYLETDPRKEFLEQEVVRLNNKQEIIASEFKYWLDYVAPKNHTGSFKTLYEKEMGVPLIRQQLKSLDFILN